MNPRFLMNPKLIEIHITIMNRMAMADPTSTIEERKMVADDVCEQLMNEHSDAEIAKISIDQVDVFRNPTPGIVH